MTYNDLLLVLKNLLALHSVYTKTHDRDILARVRAYIDRLQDAHDVLDYYDTVYSLCVATYPNNRFNINIELTFPKK